MMRTRGKPCLGARSALVHGALAAWTLMGFTPCSSAQATAERTPDCTAAAPPKQVHFDANRLKRGRFTYEIKDGNDRLGTAVIEIRGRRDGPVRISFESRDIGQSWMSSATRGFDPIAARLRLPGQSGTHTMHIEYRGRRITGQETSGEKKTEVAAEATHQVIDQRVDWASLMAARFPASRSIGFDVFDPNTSFSRLAAVVSASPPIRNALGTQPALRIDYRICKKTEVEAYSVYASQTLPRVLLREEMPNGLVSELVKVEP